MEMSIVTLVGVAAVGARSTLPSFVEVLRPRVIEGAAAGGRGFGYGTTCFSPAPTTDPVLDLTPDPTG